MSEFYTCVNKYGRNILYRGYDRDTRERIARKIPFSPTLYLPSSEDTGYTALDGVPVKPREFPDMKEARDFCEAHRDIENFRVYGNQNFVAQFIQDRFPGDISFDPSLVNVVSVDIEVAVNDDGFPHPEEAKQPVTAITLKSSQDPTYYVFGTKDFDESASQYTVQYIHCTDEANLLIRFLEYWDSDRLSPDVVTGWNTQLFDIPYLVNRINKIVGSDMMKKMSPWRVINQRTVMMMKKPREAYVLYGIQQLDYMDLFKKFGYTYGEQENYRLDTIANTVLGERKLSYDEYSNLDDMYERDYQKFLEYNVRDVELIHRMDDKLGLINLALTMAYRGGVNYTDTFGTTAIWDTIIYRLLMDQNIVVPPNEDTYKAKYDGGYVKDPQIGLHKWVVSFDLDSLYPNIIVQQNMSPETIIGHQSGVSVDRCLNRELVRDGDNAVAANGAVFRTDQQGVIPRVVSEYYGERKLIKKQMLESKKALEKAGGSDPEIERDIAHLENEQMSVKILLNSLYGALGNQYFRYFSMPMAEGITASGRLAVQWAERAVNEYMNKALGSGDKDYVIAIDTDSLYVDMGDLIERMEPENPVDFLDTICSKAIEPVISDAYQSMFEMYGGYENRMNMTREVIADRGIWTAKKRYILNVHDNEGVRYNDPKLKIMGIEAIKSSTPSACREGLKEIFKVIVTGSEQKSQDAIQMFKEYFKTLPPEEVSFPRSVSDVDKWSDPNSVYMKGTPIHVRGSLLYNHWIDKHGGSKYPKISNGDKVKFTYLKTPNPVRENVISYPAYLPVDMGLHRYIDYDTQFDKSFVDVIRPIFKAIGWEIEKQNTLEDLMG